MPDDAFTQHKHPRRVPISRHVSQEQRAASLYGTPIIVMMMLASAVVARYSPSNFNCGAGVPPAVKPATPSNFNCGAGVPPAVILATPATTQSTIQSASARVVRQFHDALKSAQPAEALKLIATSPDPIRDAERRVKRLSTSLASGNWDFSILDAKETGDIAVVLINDHLKDGRKTIDIKPWYLLRQQREWKLLGKFTDFELKEYGFDVPRITAYRALEKWANEREPQLRKEQPDCGC